MDTIGNIAFAERIDTLLKYIVFEDGCSFNFIFKDNVQRVDLKDGDILQVSSADNTVKNYRLSLYPYAPSHNATLERIIFPGIEINENPVTFLMSDTLLRFSRNGFFYKVELPEGTKELPSIIAIPTNNKSKIAINRPKSLVGKEEDRTCIIRVTAEDDTTILDYKLLFQVKINVPPLNAEPFFTDFNGIWGNKSNWNWQIFNPNDKSLDLSNYIIAYLSNVNYNAFKNSVANDLRSRYILRPGYKIVDKGNATPGFEIDYSQKDPTILSRSVYSMATERSFPNSMGNPDALNKVDFNYALVDRTTLFSEFNRGGVSAQTGHTLAIFKILSDSVKEGLKPPKDFDNDFAVVDVVNGLSSHGIPWVMYDKINNVDSVIPFVELDEFFGLYRKPSVYTGNPIDNASFGIGDKSRVLTNSEWVVYGLNLPDYSYNATYSRAIRDERFEKHIMLTYANIPNLVSSVYNIEDGYEGIKKIDGVSPETSVKEFLTNTHMLDSGMSVEVTDSEGKIKSYDEIINVGDKVKSISADKKYMVEYVITDRILSDNCMLYSSKFKIEASNGEGVISGIDFGTSINDLLAEIIVPEGAILQIIDREGCLVSKVSITQDTTNGWGERVEKTATKDILFEVTAQNGINKRIFKLEFLASDLCLYSDIYKVNQSERIIDMVTWTSVESFKSNVFANNGEIKIFDKKGIERLTGTITFDDVIVVTSTQNSTQINYWLKFLNEPGVGRGIENSLDDLKTNKCMAVPNPSSGNIILISEENISEVSVFSLSGVCVYSTRCDDKKVIIKAEHLPSGLYVGRVQYKNGKGESLKMVII